MARLINTDKSAMTQSEGGGGTSVEQKKSGPRKFSFKTRGSTTSGGRNYRATKVSVTSSSVALLASKFNAIIVEDENKGRAILKNLRANKNHVSGSVREVVEKFENFGDKPKLVLVRKNSQNKDKPFLKIKRIPETLKEEDTDNKTPNNNLNLEITKVNKDINNVQQKPKVHPKPLITNDKKPLSNTRHPVKVKSQQDFYKLEGKDVKDKRLSIPKNHILDSVLNENVTNNTEIKDVQVIKPNNSFLWGSRESVCEAKDVINTDIVIEKAAGNLSDINTVETDKENVKNNELESPVVRNVDKVGYGKINTKTAESEEELNRNNLKANSSSLYKHIINNTKNELNEVISTDSDPLLNDKEVENVNQQEGEQIIINNNNNIRPNSFLHRVSSITQSESSYEDIANYKMKTSDMETNSEQNNYEVVENFENNYDVINDYYTDEAIYDDVLNVNSERIYESIYVSQSQNDSDSSFEHNNSLYEMRPPSQASSASGALVSGASRSDTSDDWVDIEVETPEEQKEEIVILEEKFKPRTPGWSKKVRRQWSARGVNQYKQQGESDNSSGKHYEAVENPDDDSALCDDFDDSSESELSVDHNYKPDENGLQSLRPGTNESQNEGIYGFMRQARQKMRKMSSIGKRLRRISGITMAVPAPLVAQEIVNGSNENINRGGRWSSFKKKNSRSNSTFYLSNDTTNEAPRVPPIVLPQKAASNVDVRRLSTSIRPTSPPPPPPPTINGETKSKPINDTSLYMECGLFEHSNTSSDRSSRSFNSSCWYADIGLYENKKSFDSASEHDSSQGSDLDLRFADEPLYQFYAEGVAERELDGNSECGYEEIGLGNENRNLPSRPPALDLVSHELHRTLWCHVPQVIQSGILDTLSPERRRLQEAKFELITSEASYYKSLTILEKHFALSPSFKDESIISKVEYKTLFGNVAPVRKCSEAVLAALEKCWQESILLDGVCDVICQLALDRFNMYIKYCKHQSAIEKTLKHLKKNNVFIEALNVLESSPKCHHLTLSSFLLLPMQRITRMPLLQDAILTKLGPNDPEYESCKLALTRLNNIAHECNEAARQTERLEEMALLSRAITFPTTLRPLPLLSASRWLVRSGPVTQIVMDAKLTFSRKLTAPRNPKLMLFLFTDYLVVAKKKGEDNYSVITYCPRNLVQMTKTDDAISNRFLIILTMLENHEGKTQEMLLGCGSESSRERWLQPFEPISSSNPDERLYEVWDCPQVSAMHSYTSTQPDELSLQQGDVVNVLRKMNDGWYYGERIRDGVKGWFPRNHTVEVASAHVRARNLKQRHRLLALSSNFIQQQQMNKTTS